MRLNCLCFVIPFQRVTLHGRFVYQPTVTVTPPISIEMPMLFLLSIRVKKIIGLDYVSIAFQICCSYLLCIRNAGISSPATAGCAGWDQRGTEVWGMEEKSYSFAFQC